MIPGASISSGQLTKLWAAARELGMPSEELHDLARDLTGKTSLRELTMAEAGRVIDLLVERGASSGARRQLPPGVPRLATPWQLERISDMIRALGWQDARPMCEGVIRRAIGRSAPRTSAEASKVIEAFKAILERRFGDPAPREGQG